ncbi:MAG: hypothetical protein AB7U44_09065 [Sulfuricurvum sp.]|nr:hypothetical protein [Sulfuricurvum sp.]MDD3597696.1 hypothetical protein [Sulfuricurvum sp.]MDD4884834.1 hypothetical protein [Sulfuricurvum sp.]
MKFIERIDVIVKLKEKIAEAQATNSALAAQLQSLLDQILSNPQNSPAI